MRFGEKVLGSGDYAATWNRHNPTISSAQSRALSETRREAVVTAAVLRLQVNTQVSMPRSAVSRTFHASLGRLQ